MNRLQRLGLLIAKEPPFRRITKAALSMLNVRPSLRTVWDISQRPQYLLGLVTAARQARLQGETAFSAIEFGVAGGVGFLSMQRDAEAVSKETGISIRLFGFDTGTGLPESIGDHRDHPDIWQEGDYPMDQAKLRAKLSGNSTLVIGNVVDTVKHFFATYNPPPIGFVSIDLDLYSGSKAALGIFDAPGRQMLRHVAMYLDDIDMFYTHSNGGELLAVHEYNQRSTGVFIDVWRGVKSFRPFPDSPYLDRMYIAHDLNAISKAKTKRPTHQLSI
ncbi:MAG: hypothetical protein AB7K24_03235 [Gemmataceae bacterium]